MKKRISIKVIPRSSKNQIIGTQTDDTIKVKLTAAPVDGEANKQLIELLSKQWKLPKTRIQIIKGKKGREKIIEIEE